MEAAIINELDTEIFFSFKDECRKKTKERERESDKDRERVWFRNAIRRWSQKKKFNQQK